METRLKSIYCPFLSTSMVCLFGQSSMAQAQPQPRAIAYNQPLTLHSNISKSDAIAQAQRAYQSYSFDQAQSLYRQICAHQQANASDYYWLGESCAHCQDYPGAAKAFAESLRLDQTNDRVHIRYVESLLSSQKRDEATTACNEALGIVRHDWAKQKLRVLAAICSKPRPDIEGLQSRWKPKVLKER